MKMDIEFLEDVRKRNGYEEIGTFTDGFAKVKCNGRFGLIDSKFEEVIIPIFKSIVWSGNYFWLELDDNVEFSSKREKADFVARIAEKFNCSVVTIREHDFHNFDQHYLSHTKK